MKMKIELRADIAEMVSELLHGYQELVAYDVALASYCGAVAEKFDAAVESVKKDSASERDTD